ncbi:MAG: FG-GAP repeat protein [Terracidiphilus sp.]
MKKSLALVAMFTALCTMSMLAQKSQKPDPWKQAGADDSLRMAFEKAIYSLKESGHGTGTETWSGTNDTQRLSMQFDVREARLTHPDGSVGFHLSGYGYGDKLNTPAAPKLAADGTRLEYRRGDFTEWYVNGPHGLEQGFTLAKKPTGGHKGQPLTIALGVTGTLTLSQQDGAVSLKSGKSTVLRYGGLSARDALDRAIPAHMEARNNEIRLVVEDQKAQYPLTVDPTWTQWQELIPSHGEGGGFGYSVSVDGTTAVIGVGGPDGGKAAAIGS